ncbi:D-ribose pyranase [Paracoccus sp. p4-l81]|uniref:D-ribose pyranase n=1 Tax=Paracoccus sp. p4-l81 TaxID=3342806 RepID=UPI0035BAA358
MKKTALLNAELSRVIASMGHGDLLVIGDAGLPVPPGVPVIDLAVTRGVPGVFDVLDAVLSELQVERAAIAEEAAEDLAAEFSTRLPCARISHANFKEASRAARVVVRTGECTPFANVALWAGVVF